MFRLEEEALIGTRETLESLFGPRSVGGFLVATLLVRVLKGDRLCSIEYT